MRFGLCGNLAAAGPDGTGIEIVEKLKEFGYDYVELPLGEMMALSDGEKELLIKRLWSSGLKSEVCNNFFPPRIKLTGPETDRKAIRAYYTEAMDFALRLGTETIVFGSPGAKSYPDGFPREAAWEQLRELTKEIDEAACARGLRIAVEPIRKPECNIVNTFREGVNLARQVEGKATRVLLDYYHMTWEKESPEVLEEYGEWLEHIHFACPYLPGEGERNIPLDFEEWPYEKFRDALKAIHYNKRISIEAYSRCFDEHAEQSVKMLKRHFNWDR